MDKTKIVKGIASLVVGGVTAKVVKEIIQNNTDPSKVTDKAAVIIASYVLGAIAADAAKKWTDAQIDELIQWWTTKVRTEKA